MNKLKNILLFAFCLNLLSSQAQISFEKNYLNTLKQIGVQGLQLSDGYLISTKVDDCSLCDAYIQFIRINDSGDTVRTYNIPNFGNKQGPASTLFTNDQHLVIAANNTNGLTNQVTVIKSDTNGTVNWHFTLADGWFDYSANAMVSTDSSFLITGIRSVQGSPELTRTFLMNISHTGNFNWLKIYGSPYENFATGLNFRNEKIFVTGSMFDTVSQKIQPFIIDLDTSGNVNQFREIILPNDAAPTGITGDTFSNYIYGYTVDSLLNTNALLIRLDMNLDTLWTTQLDQGRFETARCGITNDQGGITFTASVSSSGNTDGDILLCKYDSVGNSVFETTISGFNNEPFSSSLIQTADGGFFIATTSYDNFMHSSACAFKTDSLGQILNAISSVTKPNLDVYPNPSSGILLLKYALQVLKIEVFNLQGQMLKESEGSQIDISEFENGIYVFKAHFSNQKTAAGKVIKTN